jgi:DNA-binding transcriptional ArsR family regulator
MNSVRPLDGDIAETYAAWFKVLADGIRVQVVSLLPRSGPPMTVKEIVTAVPVGQSTVSEHLRQLAAVRFVLAEDKGTWRPVPDQRELRGLLPHRRRPDDGQAITRAARHCPLMCREDDHAASPT